MKKLHADNCHELVKVKPRISNSEQCSSSGRCISQNILLITPLCSRMTDGANSRQNILQAFLTTRGRRCSVDEDVHLAS